MRRTLKIAVICNNTLLCLGLQYLLEEYFQPLTIERFPDMDALAASNTAFDFFFTDAESFAVNTDFFLQRRSKTVALTNCAAAGTSGFNILPMSATPENIIELLKTLFVDEENERENRELSQREIDVLQLIVQGNTNKDIADRLHISLNTVLTHRKNITSKLGIKTASGLTFYALMNGLF